MESGAPFALTQAGKQQQQQQRLRMQPSAFGGLLASARCLITFKFPFGKKNCEEPRESCAVRPRLYSLISSVRAFSRRQHNLQWEMSSSTEHDPRFHLPLKCLGCRRILAELAGLRFSLNSSRCRWLCQCHHISSKGACCIFFGVPFFLSFFFFFPWQEYLWQTLVKFKKIWEEKDAKKKSEK